MGTFIKANQLFFLLVALIVVSVFGYFWWQSGFTFQIGKFFAANDCTKSDVFGELTNDNSATVRNKTTDKTCSVGFASYKVDAGGFDDVNQQTLFKGTIIALAPGESMNISITLPSCNYQADLFIGDTLKQPPNYGSVELLGVAQNNILGDCNGVAPSPTPSATATPSPTPSATVTVTPMPVCSPATQTVALGAPATFVGSGGTASSSYGWFAPGGTPGTGSGSPFSATYSIAGQKTVTMTSGKNQTTCQVTVIAAVPQTHLICSNNTCTSVTGAGTDECTTMGSACGTTPTHLECVSNACTSVAGTGTNTCSPMGSSCGTTPTHLICSNQTCTSVVGAGTDQCSTAGASCGGGGGGGGGSPQLTIDKLVRNITQSSSEADSTNANPTDTIEFALRVSSTGSRTATSVVVRDTLPAGLTYVPASTTIDGSPASDGVASSGLNLGDMSPGRTITVRFRALVSPGTFFSSGTSVLTNTGYARGSNTSEVSDVAFVNIVNTPQNLSMSLVKMGRNLTRGETGEHTPVYASPGQIIEFILRVRNTSNAPLMNVVLRDIVPTGITAIAGSVYIGGASASNALTSTGLNLGTLAIGQEVVVVFSGRVAVALQLPAGTTTLINTVQATATGVGMLTAQLPIIIANTMVVVPPINTGPGEATLLALIISGIITLLYVGYTSTDSYRRHEVGELAKEAKKDDSFNFRR